MVEVGSQTGGNTRDEARQSTRVRCGLQEWPIGGRWDGLYGGRMNRPDYGATGGPSAQAQPVAPQRLAKQGEAAADSLGKGKARASQASKGSGQAGGNHGQGQAGGNHGGLMGRTRPLARTRALRARLRLARCAPSLVP